MGKKVRSKGGKAVMCVGSYKKIRETTGNADDLIDLVEKNIAVNPCPKRGISGIGGKRRAAKFP